MSFSARQRDYAIDWLRVCAMLTVFLFHCGRFFDHGGWHVKNNQLDSGITIFVLFLSQWIMPLFFILSGISSDYSLRFRNPSEYFRSRVHRLFIPLVFGIFVLIPPQVYIERITHNQFNGSFFEFFPHYFDGFYAFGGNFAWMGLHLWYLLMLFVFTIVTLPLFIALHHKSGRDFIAWLAGKLEYRGAIYLLALPFVILELVLNPSGIGRRDFGGWSAFLYIIFFIYGYTVFSDRRCRAMIERQAIFSLATGILLTLVALVIFLKKGEPSFSTSYFVLMTVLRAFNTWFWLLAIVGIGTRYFGYTNRFLSYANQAVLPFYIFHQTIIVIFGFYIKDWNIPVLLKYAMLSTASFITIMFLYEIFVRRINILRYLFGMKIRDKAAG
jgi:surface polysaccharide O-acyltransferase-like enzyme